MFFSKPLASLSEIPDIVLLEFAANDWWRDERPYTEWGKDLEFLIQKIKEGGAQVVILGVFGQILNTDGQRVRKKGGTDERGCICDKVQAEQEKLWILVIRWISGVHGPAPSKTDVPHPVGVGHFSCVR